MHKVVARCALLSFALLPCAAVGEPVELKLAFFGSDRSASYLAAMKPFVDAVNFEGRGLVRIVLYSGGVLGRDIAQQPQVVLDGKADIAFVVPGYTPDRFPDNAVVELPGLFHDTREATLAYTRLVALNALRGYDDFVVVGAYVTEQETIHSRGPITSIDDLKGKRIRVNSPGGAAALERLGAVPVPMEITRIAAAISSGTIDGAAVPRTPLSDYGIKRIATSHFFLATSGAPLALVMNRRIFEALPKPAQAVIRKYSGEWAAEKFIESYDLSDQKVLEELRSDPNRTIFLPSSSDLNRARRAFDSVTADWLGTNPHRQRLLKMTESELAKLRATR